MLAGIGERTRSSRKTITEQKISLLKFLVQFFEFFRSRDEVKSRHFDEFRVSAGLTSYSYASQSLAIVLNFYIFSRLRRKDSGQAFFSSPEASSILFPIKTDDKLRKLNWLSCVSLSLPVFVRQNPKHGHFLAISYRRMDAKEIKSKLRKYLSSNDVRSGR